MIDLKSTLTSKVGASVVVIDTEGVEYSGHVKWHQDVLCIHNGVDHWPVPSSYDKLSWQLDPDYYSSLTDEEKYGPPPVEEAPLDENGDPLPPLEEEVPE